MTRHVLTFGESMGVAVGVRALPFASSRDLHLSIGGAESNVAIGLARLGVRTVWASRLGADSIGELVRTQLADEHVELMTHLDADAPTGFMLKERLPDGSANVNYYRGGSAASRLSPGDIPADLVEGARLVHFSGVVLALSESARQLALEVVDRAVRCGVPVSFDLNYRPALWSRAAAAEAYRQILPHCEIVFAGTDEAAIVSDASSLESQARSLCEMGPRITVIKRGADGAVALSAGEFHSQTPFEIDVVDTVGAGDAFAAGYLAAHLRGASPSECLERGSATGALACRSAGDWEAAATPRELEALVALGVTGSELTRGA